MLIVQSWFSSAPEVLLGFNLNLRNWRFNSSLRLNYYCDSELSVVSGKNYYLNKKMEECGAGVLTDDEDMLELIDIVDRQRARKIYNERVNHFEKWDDNAFLKRFRLSKHGVRFILENIAGQISPRTQRNHAVSAQDMLFVTLTFFATGSSFLQVVGDFVGIDVSTACRIVKKVSRAIASLHETFIRMPETEDEMIRNSSEFYNISRFPKCIGALVCTNLKISSPGENQPEIFRNRQHFFSVNVQAICDAHMKIQNIVCRWPGSCHDSTIFNNSQVRAKFERREYGNYRLVGDSGYGIRPFLAPLANPMTAAENLFNEAQIRTGNPIERCFGIWKRRFPVLAFGIRLKLEKVEAIVIATAVLHNIACMLNEPLPAINENEEAAIQFVNNVDLENARDDPVNNGVRYQLIHEYFNNLH